MPSPACSRSSDWRMPWTTSARCASIVYPLSAMMRSVLELRENFTAYDAAYIVLAQALEAPLVTADAKLAEARRLGVDVRVLRPRQ